MKDEGLRWVRISRGFYLLGLGTFLLLTTQDLLPPTFWGDAAAYWPVLLVAIGIRLVFERGPAPWLVLLGPTLVLGTLMYVAMQGPGRTVLEGDWAPVRIERPADLSAWRIEGGLAAASLEVKSRRLPRDILVEGRATETGRHSVRVEETAPGRVRVTNSLFGRTILVMPGRRRARCELGVTTALPVAFDLDLAFTETRLDVGNVPVSRVAVDGAFNDLSLRLGAPSSDVHLDLEGAFNQVVLEVPARTPVRVTSEGFLNVVDKRTAEGAAADRAAADGAPGYRVQLEGAFNRVVVRSW